MQIPKRVPKCEPALVRVGWFTANQTHGWSQQEELYGIVRCLFLYTMKRRRPMFVPMALTHYSLTRSPHMGAPLVWLFGHSSFARVCCLNFLIIQFRTWILLELELLVCLYNKIGRQKRVLKVQKGITFFSEVFICTEAKDWPTQKKASLLPSDLLFLNRI